MSSTVRMKRRDKKVLAKIRYVLLQNTGKNLSQEETLGLLLRHAYARVTDLVALAKRGKTLDIASDGLWNTAIKFSMGRTDSRSHDRLLYGGRRPR